MLRQLLTAAATTALAAMMLAGSVSAPDGGVTLLDQGGMVAAADGPGAPAHPARAVWRFTAPPVWALRWSYWDCPDGLFWTDAVGVSIDPVHAQERRRRGELVVTVSMPTIIQYRYGRDWSGVEHFREGGPVRLRVTSRCDWRIRVVTA